MILNALVVAGKRALDYIDRNIIKEQFEDEPDNKRLIAVTKFLSKTSSYHYADHAAQIINILASFALLSVVVIRRYTAGDWPVAVVPAAYLGFYIIYTALADILPKKLAAQSSETTGVRLV